ncbi:hypothetical protein [Vibrio sp.]|uniref:hypothetical protein n=1 Tax=Vibrio sp. TaxID=678 RepID=UPI003D108626
MRKYLLLITTFLVILLLAASPFALPTPVLNWWAIGPSLKTASQGDVVLTGMVGQGITSAVSLADSELCAGFLCMAAEFIESLKDLFLPLILK